MGIESRRWESLSLKQPGLGKMVVSELFLPWTRKIPSELPFSPCGNSRNQAATALGERLSFSWLLRWQRPWESWYFWPTLPTSYHPAREPKLDISASLFIPLWSSRSAPDCSFSNLTNPAQPSDLHNFGSQLLFKVNGVLLFKIIFVWFCPCVDTFRFFCVSPFWFRCLADSSFIHLFIQ